MMQRLIARIPGKAVRATSERRTEELPLSPVPASEIAAMEGARAPEGEQLAQDRVAMVRFGREWLKSPLRVGAVVPSSSSLARAITDGLTAADGPVLELGPGTGVFTEALLKRGIAGSDIAAIEASPGFAAALALRFPEVRVIAGDAARIRQLSPFGVGGAGVVICGLPLLSMPVSKRMRIMSGALDTLRPGGSFRLFTYGLRCPIPESVLDRLGLTARRASFVARNLPVASVYVLDRRTGE